MLKYRTYWGKITPIEVIRETEKTVVLPGHRGREIREAKRSEWQNWHDTWEDARQFLLNKAQSRVDSLRAQLERAKGELGNIKGMKAP